MRTYAARAVPWLLVVVASVLTVVLLAAVRYDAWTLWPLQGTAVGLVAAITGWCLDEPAAAVTDVCPRRLAWRTAARGPGIALALLAWCLGVWWARDELFGHAGAVLVQGLAAAMIAVAWVTVRRATGEGTPGQRWALAIVPATTAWALVRPFEHRLPVFPYALGGPTGDWTVSLWCWLAAGAAAAVVAGTVLVRDGRPLRSLRLLGSIRS